MKKYLGMTKKDLKTLAKILKFEVSTAGKPYKTLQQAINDGDIYIISERTSKKGVELVKLSNGKEFEKKNLATTTFFS
jgi:hypothetical protein